jgi:hypothetical protein
MKNIMKKSYKYICMVMLTMLMYSCDTENDVLLPSSFSYISFETSQKSVNEPDGEVKIKFQYSTQNISNKDLTFNYTVSFPEGKTKAVENVDYTLPANSGTFTLPAGKSEVEITLLTLVDNNTSKGLRHIQFNLTPIDGVTLGSPSDDDAGSVTILIQEDDLYTFGRTSFEDVPTFIDDWHYTLTSSQQDLKNTQLANSSSKDPYVDFAATANEMGFDTRWAPGTSRKDDQERMGVFNNTNMNKTKYLTTSFKDGVQGYAATDMDGTIELRFDLMNQITPSVNSLVIDLGVYFGDTSWESPDGFEVYYETADGLGDALYSVFDNDVEKIAGKWNDLKINVPASQTKPGRIVLRLSSTFWSEGIYLDYVAIKGIP